MSEWQVVKTRLQGQYTRDQTIISDRVQSVLREVLHIDVANIVYEYIFPMKRIDYKREPLFDVWYQNEWMEARIIRPVMSGSVNPPGEFPEFVQLDDFPHFVKEKFVSDRVAAYQSRILHPRSHYYSMEELKTASDEKRLIVCDAEMRYYAAQIIKTDGDDLVWIRYYDEILDECVPIQSYRLYILCDVHRDRYPTSHGIALYIWRYHLSDLMKCYHQFQMLTLDLLISHDFDEESIRASLARHVCQVIVP
jgi:hypothetical protein